MSNRKEDVHKGPEKPEDVEFSAWVLVACALGLAALWAYAVIRQLLR